MLDYLKKNSVLRLFCLCNYLFFHSLYYAMYIHNVGPVYYSYVYEYSVKTY